MTAFFPVLNTPTTSYTVQSGTGFLDPGYWAARKQVHESVDFNAVTGSDTDLGDPIHAADDGAVTAAYWHASIGGIVLIAHADGSETHYWHLRDIHVKKGQHVQGGDMIGQIGKGGGGRFWAHLHFGVRKKAGVLPPDHWPSTHVKDRAACEAYVREHYHDPLAWLKARGAKRYLSDLQALRNDPTRVLLVRGDEITDVTGQLVPVPGNAVSIDARSSTVRVIVRPNDADVVRHQAEMIRELRERLGDNDDHE